MRALVVYCHPSEASFTAAIRDLVLARLEEAGVETRLTDLYARRYVPALDRAEWEGYPDTERNRRPVAQDVADVEWCDTVIFVYPTWWYGLPALLKGWLDRTMVPGLAFTIPEAPGQGIRPGLTHIRRLGVFTTCGASWWLTAYVGAPGKRTLLRGFGALCAKPLRTAFAAHYNMDTSTAQSRARHLERVSRQMDRLLAGAAPATREAMA